MFPTDKKLQEGVIMASVVIKGSKNGITLILNEEEEFDVLKEKVAKKFSDSAKFLGSAKTALAFEGRKLSDAQKEELVKCIKENSELDIVCLMDFSEEGNLKYEQAVESTIMGMNAANVKIYKGGLRSGQSIESDNGVVVLGDVNPGASLISKGNVIVLGALRGTVWAGAGGNKNAFVVSSEMTPMQVRIADTIARSPDRQDRKDDKNLKIAYLDENGSICIAPLSKEIINSLVI